MPITCFSGLVSAITVRMSKAMRQRNLIVAAGGVVYRFEDDELLCAVVKSAKHNAWCLPKGKVKSCDPTLLDTAVREVQEETGCLVESLGYAGSFKYQVTEGTKVVAFWHMRVTQENWQPLHDDILAMKWLPLAETIAVLHRAEERSFLCRILQADTKTSRTSRALKLIRHDFQESFPASTELRLSNTLYK